MITKLDHKIIGGKMLRLEADLDKGVICSIKICGDFFVHPEQGIFLIEEALKGKSITDMQVAGVQDIIEEIVEQNKLVIIGFTAKDLAEAILFAGSR